MTFGEKLQQLRKKRRLSQEQLAEQLGVSRQAISKWELGTIPDIKNLIQLRNFFNCSLDELVCDEASPPPQVTPPRRAGRTEKLCFWWFLGSVLVMLGLWIASSIWRFPSYNNIDYYGVANFVMYFRLGAPVFLMTLLATAAICVRVFLQLRAPGHTTRFRTARKISLALYLLGLLWWLLCAMLPGMYLEENWFTYLVLALYAGAVVVCLLAAYPQDSQGVS